MGVDLVRIFAECGENVIVTSRSHRKSDFEYVTYVQGDAHDTIFLKALLNKSYDAIVDFMDYSTDEFEKRRDLLLRSTKQYIFLSSCRVYADSKRPITEDSSRLIDVSADKEYLKTDEYALKKARQENLLHESGRTNWTIIRPYITYSNQRLQLGSYEKELWLYRALHDQTIIFPRAIAEKYTTMTLGEDVARGISKLIGNAEAMGKTFHITTNETIRWDNVLGIYKRVLKEVAGIEIKVRYIDDPKPIYDAMGNKYQVVYDRVFNRKFDNSRFINTVGGCKFTLPEEGLERCLREFLAKSEFKGHLNYVVMDKMARERTRLSEINGFKQKVKYLMAWYLPDDIIRFMKFVLGR